jgi:hypothetical protein
MGLTFVEEQKALEAIKLGFGKRPRKSDETLVDSGGEGVGE